MTVVCVLLWNCFLLRRRGGRGIPFESMLQLVLPAVSLRLTKPEKQEETCSNHRRSDLADHHYHVRFQPTHRLLHRDDVVEELNDSGVLFYESLQTELPLHRKILGGYFDLKCDISETPQN